MFLKGDYRVQILSPLMRVKASFEVALKSTQARGCSKPMLHKISILRSKVSSYPFPLPS